MTSNKIRLMIRVSIVLVSPNQLYEQYEVINENLSFNHPP